MITIRKLASIQRIKSIEPIENADAVELARILGWDVVVRKGEFKVGDLVVYFEPDSICPDTPDFDFLRSQKGKIKPLKPKKIRGVLSQGLVMPLHILDKFPDIPDYIEGADVTEWLGVKKYDPLEVEFRTGEAARNIAPFPMFIEKTDEERVQTLLDLDRYDGKKFIVTEKIDGTSFTCYIHDDVVGICTRNHETNKDGNSPYAIVYQIYDIENKMRLAKEKFGIEFAVQGEVYGVKIQKNKYNINTNSLAVFNVINLETNEQYSPYESLGKEICDFIGLPKVPLIDDDFTMKDDIDYLINMSKGFSKFKENQVREGIVFRLRKEEFDAIKKDNPGYQRRRYSFKAINPDFLCSN